MKPEAAELFHALHRGPDVLVLANAWDAVSARLAQEAGGQAIATSSAALAWAHGYSDGHDLPFPLLVRAVAEIARVVRAPVSVDSEGGYAETREHVRENVAALIGVGAVGINLEDGAGAHDLHLRKVDGAREAGLAAGVDVFINARTDVFLKKLVPAEAAVEETIRRGRALREAGASGLFVPGLVKGADIAAVAGGVDLPLNVMVWPGLPARAELAGLGVRRLSAGEALARVALAAARAAAEAWLKDGDSGALLAAAGPSVDFYGYFAGG